MIWAVLERIFARAGRNNSSRAPLYSYRINEREKEDLAREVASEAREDLRRRGRLGSHAAAGFCLFGAEHFRDVHESGPWRWVEILEPVGLPYDTTVLYEAVRRGLEFWGRPLLRTASASEYLLTIACEGGLPLKLLRDPNSALRRYFREFLQAKEQFQATAARDLAERLDYLLPVSLRQEVVFELATRLIDSVVEARERVGAAADPLGRIRAVDPTWEERVPVRVDDELACDLLRGLLAEPRDRATRLTTIDLPTFLVQDLRSGTLSLERRADVPSQIAASALDAQIGIELPARVQLHAVFPDGERRTIAVATRGGDTYWTSLRHAGPLPATPSDQAIRLVASRGSAELGQVDLAATTLPGLPWVFCDAGQGIAEHRCLGVGSVSTRADAVLVALPADWRIDAPATSQEIGRIAGCDRRVVRLTGTTCVEGDGERCVIRTASHREHGGRFRVSGQLLLGGACGAVFVGTPRVIEESDGQVLPVAAEWRPTDRPRSPWLPLDARARGNVRLRVVRSGETQLLARAVILPGSARVRLEPHRTPGHGTIWLEGLTIRDVGLVDAAAFSMRLAREGPDRMGVVLETTGPRPPTIALRVLLADDHLADLTLPFPSCDPVFIGRDGRVLSGSPRIALHQLLGARASVLSAARVNPRIDAKAEGRLPSILANLQRLTDDSYALPLDRVADQVEVLLCSRDHIDGDVALHLIVPPNPRGPSVRVSRYDGQLAPRKDDTGIDLTLDTVAANRISRPDQESLRVEARRLERPEDCPELLPRVGEGRWRFDFSRRSPGFWLLTTWQGELARIRPLRVEVPGEPAPPESELGRATRIAEDQQRRQAMDAIVTSLAMDLGHVEWPRAQAFIDTLVSLPAHTFDIVRAIARNSDAAAVVLLRQPTAQMVGAVWNRLEELPFQWALVPLRSWLAAARLLAEHLRTILAGCGEAVAAAETRALFRRVAAPLVGRAPFMRSIFERLERELGEIGPFLTTAEGHLDDDDVIRALHSAYNSLRCGNAEVEFWPHLGAWREALRQDIPRWWPWPDEDLARADVVEAPVLAAVASFKNVALTREQMIEMRLLRTFDPDWFDAAHSIVLHQLVSSSALYGSAQGATHA